MASFLCENVSTIENRLNKISGKCSTEAMRHCGVIDAYGHFCSQNGLV